MEEKKKSPQKQKINIKEWWTKKRIILTYGLANFGTHWFNGFYGGLRTIFFVEVAGMTNILAGAVDLVVKAAKPWFTFLTGVIVEARPFKRGKYFPWLQIGSVAYLSAAVIMYAAPFIFPEGAARATFVAVLFAFITLVTTVLGVVRVIIYANVSSNNTERTTAGAASSLLLNTAKQLSGIVYPLVFGIFVGMFGDKKAFLPTSILMGSVTLICYFIVAHDVKKYLNDDAIEAKPAAAQKKKKGISVKEVTKLLLTNKALLVMTFGFTLYQARNMAVGGLTVIYFKNVLGDMKLLALSRTVGFFATWIITPIVPFLVQKFFMKNVYLGAMGLMTAVSFTYMIPAVGLQPLVFIAFNTVAKACVPVIGTTTLAMFANAIDYGEWKNGTRQSGIQMTLFSLAAQWAAIVAIVIRTTLLEFIGYKAGMVFNMPVKLLFIRVYGLSAVMYLVVWLAVLFFYPINKEMQIQIENDLEAKRAAEGIQ